MPIMLGIFITLLVLQPLPNQWQSKSIIVNGLLTNSSEDELPLQEVLESKREAEEGGIQVVCKLPTRNSRLSFLKKLTFWRTKSTTAPSLHDVMSGKRHGANMYPLKRTELEYTPPSSPPTTTLQSSGSTLNKFGFNDEIIFKVANQLPEAIRVSYIADQYKNQLETYYETRLKKKDDRNEVLLFFVSTCGIKDEVNIVFKDSLKRFNAAQLAADWCSTKPIVAPPEEVRGQIYDTKVENWLINWYKKWLHFITYDQTPLTKCFRRQLNEKGYSYHQMAWSYPKVYKFYNRYSHPNDSPTAVEFDKFILFKNQVSANEKNVTGIRTSAEYEVYQLIKFHGKTFLDILEERNSWFVTLQDCHMINILQACKDQTQFECRPLKNSPELVVPLYQNGVGKMIKDPCNVWI